MMDSFAKTQKMLEEEARIDCRTSGSTATMVRDISFHFETKTLRSLDHVLEPRADVAASRRVHLALLELLLPLALLLALLPVPLRGRLRGVAERGGSVVLCCGSAVPTHALHLRLQETPVAPEHILHGLRPADALNRLQDVGSDVKARLDPPLPVVREHDVVMRDSHSVHPAREPASRWL